MGLLGRTSAAYLMREKVYHVKYVCAPLLALTCHVKYGVGFASHLHYCSYQLYDPGTNYVQNKPGTCLIQHYQVCCDMCIYIIVGCSKTGQLDFKCIPHPHSHPSECLCFLFRVLFYSFRDIPNDSMRYITATLYFRNNQKRLPCSYIKILFCSVLLYF